MLKGIERMTSRRGNGYRMLPQYILNHVQSP
jgi:hypothetical protein